MKSNYLAPAHQNKRSSRPKRNSNRTSKTRKTDIDPPPHEYLDVIMVLKDSVRNNPSSKKKFPKRDMSSALTAATPPMQKTFSSLKFRSKSSHERRRKQNLNEALQINVSEVITQEDNLINFTQQAAEEVYNQQFLKCSMAPKNQQQCAKIIQRAWKNYKTKKMVEKYYLYYCYRSRNRYLNSWDDQEEKQIRQRQVIQSYHNIPNQIIYGSSQSSRIRHNKQTQTSVPYEQKYLQKTLKIKHNDVSQQPPHHGNALLNTQRIGPCKVVAATRISETQGISKIKNQHEKEVERVQSIISLIEKQTQYKSNEEILQDLIKRLELNKQMLEHDLNGQIQSLRVECHRKHSSSNSSSNSSKNSSHSDNINSCSHYSESIDHLDLDGELSSSSLLNDSFNAEYRLYQTKLEYLKEKYDLQVLELERMQAKSIIDAVQKKKRRDQLQGRYVRQKNQIQYHKREYSRVLSNLKDTAIKCQKEAIFLQQAKQKQKKNLKEKGFFFPRRCFSAESIVLKCILQDQEKNGFEIQSVEDFYTSQSAHSQALGIVYSEGMQFDREGLSMTDFQRVNLMPLKENQELEGQVKGNFQMESSQGRQTQRLREFSQGIQEEVEKQLVEEFMEEIYREDGLYRLFKPFIEEPFEFKVITDSEILEFCSEITEFFPQSEAIIRSLNQNINPTTFQILRLIRDIDYEIPEYDLIIPEGAFKAYRHHFEDAYAIKKASHINKIAYGSQIITQSLLPIILQVSLLAKQDEKESKLDKYYNFERDLHIMYMKSVFNCLNQFIIQEKTALIYANSRSVIGPGELTLALKEYSKELDKQKCDTVIQRSFKRIKKVIDGKLMIPSFQSYRDLEMFQKQICRQLKVELDESECKWVNFMDQVLQIWHELSLSITNILFTQLAFDFPSFLN